MQTPSPDCLWLLNGDPNTANAALGFWLQWVQLRAIKISGKSCNLLMKGPSWKTEEKVTYPAKWL